MCRGRPGPRCSHGGRNRHAKAVRNLTMIQARYDDAEGEREDGIVPKRLRDQLQRAKLRLNAAQNVYWATPDGQKDLREQIDTGAEEITAYGENVPRSGTRERNRFNSVRRNLEARRNRLSEGIARRSNSYQDLRLVAGERKILRAESFARGGEMGPNAHPLTPATQERRRALVTPENRTVREWEANDVARAGTWVETGANPAYKRNGRALPFRSGRDEEGNTIKLGSKVEGEEPFSKALRLNTPDGQVVEGRHDFHLTKNDDDKYVVSVRSTVAASWEDSSPIDVTSQELGHIMASRTGVGRADSKFVVGSYTSKRAAKTALAAAKRDFDAPKVTAMMGRDTLVARAGQSSRPLQRRGIVVWHRYAAADDTRGAAAEDA